MKKLVTLLFLFISIISFAQVEVGSDTLIRPSISGRTRPTIKDNNIYFVPKLGNIIEGVTTLKSINEFTTYTNKQGIYDGSVWTRRAGVTSSTTNGYNILVTQSVNGFYYAREIKDKVITPEMFGAKGDSITNDYTALQAFFNITGDYVHYLPNRYSSGSEIIRLNKGQITIKGSVNSAIYFFNNTSGLTINNQTSKLIYKPITIDGLQIVSTGTKSGTTTGLYLGTHQYSRPGISIKNSAVKGQAANNEWTNGILLYNGSNTILSNVYVYGYTRNVTKGIVIRNGEGQPSTVHNWDHLSLENLNTGISIEADTSVGSAGLEGFGFTDIAIVNVRNGIKGITNHGSPGLVFNNVHINHSGEGAGVYLKGYQQIVFNGLYDYASAFESDPFPSRAVYLENAVNFKGNMDIHLYGNTPVGLELAGNGGIGDLSVTGDFGNSSTQFVRQACTVGAIVTTNVIYNGSGGVSENKVFMVGGCTGVKYMTVSNELANDNDIYTYDASPGNYKFRPRKSITLIKPVLTVTASATIDPSLYGRITVANSTSAVILTIDQSKFVPGQELTIDRFDNSSTGAITIQTANGALIQNFTNGASATTATLPPTSNGAVTWWWNTVGLKVANGIFVGTLGQQDINNVSSTTFNGDLNIVSATNRVFGVTSGFVAGHTVMMQLGNSGNQIIAGFGSQVIESWYHGGIIRNSVGAIGPALTVQSRESSQSILVLKDSGGNTIGNIAQSGVTTLTNDIEITDATKGIIIRNANGNRYRITINNAGQLVTTQL